MALVLPVCFLRILIFVFWLYFSSAVLKHFVKVSQTSKSNRFHSFPWQRLSVKMEEQLNPPRLKKCNFYFFHQNNQADVEKATEVLSGYLERDISQDSLQDIKQKVQDKYRWASERQYCRCGGEIDVRGGRWRSACGVVADTVRAGGECCYSTCTKAMRRTCGSTSRIEDTSQCNGLWVSRQTRALMQLKQGSTGLLPPLFWQTNHFCIIFFPGFV